ncbi:hypothetical protein H6G17_29240 [Chroococcidiopsis sp. FACHB-1243]|uniref:CVNH domain-containing protein n=1 Tax=Chroococcidiopsis sp. [FACHB-1243] TaxID=2692781 RepID=UPI00177F69E9|nr:CVNH domain-containing protein [Chroococcidiopsis sp. [FACHB-1243]]MBD2309529.1 hypothetical protein [Chroococcidiopsis sp. [FACHB-1243]]
MNPRMQNQESHKSFKVDRYQKRAVSEYKYIFKNFKNPFQVFLALSIALSVNFLLVDVDNKAMADSITGGECKNLNLKPGDSYELAGECKKADGTYEKETTVNLTAHIKSVDGTLDWTRSGERGDFNKNEQCTEIKLDEDKAYLTASCKDKNSNRVSAVLDLSKEIVNSGGWLKRKTHPDPADNVDSCYFVPGQPPFTRCW